MVDYLVAVRRAAPSRMAVSFLVRLFATGLGDWGAGHGWPPMYVDLTTRDGDLVQTVAGPMASDEASLLAARVSADLRSLDSEEFAARYFG